MKKKTALIFGINGQDGAYLAKILTKKKYHVYGVSRRKNYINLKKLDILRKQIIIYLILTILKSKFIKNFNQIYFLAGQSSVKSFTKNTFL